MRHLRTPEVSLQACPPLRSGRASAAAADHGEPSAPVQLSGQHDAYRGPAPATPQPSKASEALPPKAASTSAHASRLRASRASHRPRSWARRSSLPISPGLFAAPSIQGAFVPTTTTCQSTPPPNSPRPKPQIVTSCESAPNGFVFQLRRRLDKRQAFAGGSPRTPPEVRVAEARRFCNPPVPPPSAANTS